MEDQEGVQRELERLANELTAENAPDLLEPFECPVCRVAGGYETFKHQTSNHIGLICRTNGCEHPFQAFRILWLRQGAARPSNDILSVIAERGAYCWLCGCEYDLLRQYGIGMTVHHTKPFAIYGDDVEKIPLCALCHEIANAVQRHHGRLLAEAS